MRKDDGQLIAEYLEGDESALAVLVDRHLTSVYNFSLVLTHDLQVADDVTQEAFIKAWKHIRSFRQGSSFQTWLFTIARNTAIDTLRQKKVLTFSSFENAQGENPLVEALRDAEPLPDELIERAENTALVQGLLTQLDPRYREVLILRYSSNMTFEAIGAALRRPLHTVKSQHRRAVASLKRLLEVKPA